MDIPVQIQFRNLEPSPYVEKAVRKRAGQLEHFHGHIVSCRVTIEAPHKHHHQGNLYHVVVDVRTPTGEAIASRSPGEHQAHTDVYVAIRDAFNAVRRQLQDAIRVTRGKVKAHDEPPHGRIMRLFPDYGLITDSAGREVYFHRNSIVNADFDSLAVDAEVRFDEEAGDKGPQASSVYLVGKHHIVA